MNTIHTFLLDKVYHIPNYQREYSWDIDQLDDFWQDLTNTIEENRKTHFFGQIVIHENEEDKKFYLIDGQQRTTTSVIFLAAIRDFMANYTNNEEADIVREDIRVKYIGRFTSTKNELRLELGESNVEFFKDNIQRKFQPVKPQTHSQELILNAYYFFQQKLNKLISDLDDDSSVSKVKQYYETFINNFNVMKIVTDEINEAFVIFETLNARGKDLETADLLKNYVLMQSGLNVHSVQKSWTHMMDGLAKKEDATKFIRYHWNSNHSFTRERALYKNITLSVDSKNCLDFVKKLDCSIELYNALVYPSDNTYYSDKKIKELLINLSTMGASTFYPLMFAMSEKKFNESDIKLVLKSIETLVLRNFIVGGLTANKFEHTFASIALNITKNNMNVSNVLKQIRDATNDDEKFQRDLVGLKIKKASVAKYVLREIEDLDANEKMTNKDNKVINLEHIMPQKKGKWDVTDDFHNKNLFRLANQTLLLDEYNKSISNDIFEKKREMYVNSAITITHDLWQYKKWTEEELNERERFLNDKIIKRWALITSN